jgi:DNA helicase-2/ATP-dependent DNA helicase PcrA
VPTHIEARIQELQEITRFFENKVVDDGSGKTRIIEHRVSYLIEKGVDPCSILLLTFNRKAAKEMLDRVESLLDEKEVSKLTGGTFHSFANYVFRKYSNLLGLSF